MSRVEISQLVWQRTQTRREGPLTSVDQLFIQKLKGYCRTTARQIDYLRRRELDSAAKAASNRRIIIPAPQEMARVVSMQDKREKLMTRYKKYQRDITRKTLALAAANRLFQDGININS